LEILKIQSDNWKIPMLPKFKVGFLEDLEMSSSKYVMLDPAFPYIYLPSDDFETYASRII
jgi:hypothetical protein